MTGKASVLILDWWLEAGQATSVIVLLMGLLPQSLRAGLTPEQLQQLPPPAPGKVEFSQHIKPILEASCIKCHGHGRSKGNFRIDTRQTVLQGGDSGAAVVPGKSAQSLLIELVSGLDPDNVMPQKGSRLKPEQVGQLRAWIDEGLPWDTNITFGRVPPVNLTPRHLPLPHAQDSASNQHPIDLWIQAYFKAHQISPPPLVEDRIYARRVYLDTIGLLPTRDDLARFSADLRADKRARLVDRLLADNLRYAEHWLTFWNDALRNDYQGTGYIDGGRRQITSWLFDALVKNLPYDHFVSQLVNPTEVCAGFTKGIVWRGVVNASQTPQMQAAQNISQVFMGINLKCASCHDSFINDWTLADAYGLAGIYADGPLEMVRCDKPTGQTAALKFLFPELGTVDDKMDRPTRLKRLAEVITQKPNGRLTRTIVNRLWARFFGHGLVEPVDEMDHPAWNQDLLDWLAEDLADHEYNLKHTIALILTSQAYQLPAINQDDQKEDRYEFHGPLVRRLSAEQFVDAISELTGIWNPLPANTDIDFRPAYDNTGPSSDQPTERVASASSRMMLNPQWIGEAEDLSTDSSVRTLYYRKVVKVPKRALAQAILVCAADREFSLYVNGKELASASDGHHPRIVDCLAYLAPGENLIVIQASKDTPATSSSWQRPALLLAGRIRTEADTQDDTGVYDFATDATWECCRQPNPGWEQPGFAGSEWQPVSEYGNVSSEPWRLGQSFARAMSVAAMQNRVRAALVNNNALMTALGRPNREQVVTTRPTAATTLQALELTNGSILADWLRRGGEHLLRHAPKAASAFIEQLYQQAYGRGPDREELALAMELTGNPVGREGLEDLLWCITMSPEFQLIY